jgi:hypothetical protein
MTTIPCYGGPFDGHEAEDTGAALTLRLLLSPEVGRHIHAGMADVPVLDGGWSEAIYLLRTHPRDGTRLAYSFDRVETHDAGHSSGA